MTIALVQQSSIGVFTGKATGATGTISLTGTTPGNMLALLVPWVDGNSTGAGLSNVSDGVNVWNNPTTLGDVTSYHNHVSSTIYSAFNIAGGNVSLTLTNTATAGASSYYYPILLEFSGVLSAAANDVPGNANANGNSTGPVQCTGGTLANAGDLVLNMFGLNSAETGLTTPVGWSSIAIGIGYPSHGYAYLVPGSVSALSPSWGLMSGAANWTNAMAAYKPGAILVPSRQRSRRSHGY